MTDPRADRDPLAEARRPERVDLAEVERDLGDLAIRQPWGYRAAAGERILKRTPAMVAELWVGRKLLERLVGIEPVHTDGCLYCDGPGWLDLASTEQYPHAADCPWLEAVNECAAVRAALTIAEIESISQPGAAP